MLDAIKNHPFIAGGAVLVLGVLFLAMRGGGSATVAQATDPAALAASTQLQTAQIQAGVAVAGQNAALQAQAEHDATALQALDLQGKYGFDVSQLQAQIANSQIQLQAQQSTLAAQVQTASINADVQKTAITTNGQVQTTQAIANALVKEAQISASVATAAIANQCHGFGCLFS